MRQAAQVKVFLWQSRGLVAKGNELPRLVYVSRVKRLGFQHHKKAGARNALVRVSAVLTNGPWETCVSRSLSTEI
ncbi:hypothetical protein BT93_I0450 [Corymbia citriodora subsp. variegata]|nr:hypothetical protein BT93_I0450 [Corymbia citriodora subsp. variegata]